MPVACKDMKVCGSESANTTHGQPSLHGAQDRMLNPDYEPIYTFHCYEENLRFIAEDYFRAELVNHEHFPVNEVGKRPIVLLPNHSGMSLSWDTIILDFLVYDLLKKARNSSEEALFHKVVRIVDPILVEDRGITPFGIERWWSRTGCVSATYANCERAIREKRIVCVAPEGVAGIAKGFSRRYKLQRFSSSFMSLALRYSAIVISVSIVNAEYLRPYNYTNGWLNYLFRRIWGMPFGAMGIGVSQLLFPATFLTPMPAKLTYVLEQPVEFKTPERPPNREELRVATDRFRIRHQELLTQAVLRFHKPYALKSLWRRFCRSHQKKMFLPFFWHEMFLETAGLPHWLHWLYKIPLGYPAIWIAKRLATPRHSLRTER
jgi:hypothetical protein